MIDAEYAIYNAVVTKLREKHKNIFATGDVSSSPAKFPAVSIVEIDNSVYIRARTGVIENAASVAYEVNIYSDRVGYGKMECKNILADVDSLFTELGFTRTFSNPIQNLEDKDIYRMVARYEGVIDKDFWVYQK